LWHISSATGTSSSALYCDYLFPIFFLLFLLSPYPPAVFLLLLLAPFTRTQGEREIERPRGRRGSETERASKMERRRKAMWLYPKVVGFNPPERWGHSACFFEGVIYVFGVCIRARPFSCFFTSIATSLVRLLFF
jgi:hypothetical protein